MSFRSDEVCSARADNCTAHGWVTVTNYYSEAASLFRMGKETGLPERNAPESKVTPQAPSQITVIAGSF
jgi:hypothetical protein